MQRGESPSPEEKQSTCFQRVCVTFAGDVVSARCGEASAAVAVDGCDSELVPALRSQIRQNHIFRERLKIQTRHVKQWLGASFSVHALITVSSTRLNYMLHDS